jgi:thiol-disulfide isomerase/thioredoxin
VTPGLIALAVALAVALVTGLAWQRTNGRMRGVRGVRQISGTGGMRGKTAAGAPQGHAPQDQQDQAQQQAAAAGPVLTGAEIGLPLGDRATLVQFSTAFCAPCRATRRILGEVAGMIDGVTHVDIDAESHLDLVRRLDIRRTPTVLVLGPDGRVVKRASGQPRKADVIAAVGELP